MKKYILKLLPLMLVILAVAWSPVSATDADPVEYKVKIINGTVDSFVLKLQGDQNYTFEIGRESTMKVKVLEGEYEYFYEVCGGDFLGEIEIGDNDTVFETYNCAIQPIPTKFVIESHFGDPIVVSLTGPLQVPALSRDYTATANLGNNRYDIDSGDYTYSYDACDTTFTGQFKVLKSGTTRLRLSACETIALRALRAQFTSLDPVKFRVANRFAIDIVITLIGPETHTITVQPGMNRHEVISGTYNYIFAAFGIRYEGIIVVSPNGDTILMVPFSLSSTDKM